MKLVKYVGNADDSATGAITFSGDDRPDIVRGAVGEMTDQEVAFLSSRGIVLEVVDDGGLDGMTIKDLQKLAEKKSIDVDGLEKKDDLVSAVRTGLASAGEFEQPTQAIGGTSEGVATGGAGTGTSTSIGSPPPAA